MVIYRDNINSFKPHGVAHRPSDEGGAHRPRESVGPQMRAVMALHLQSISLRHNPNLKGSLPGFHKNNSLQILSIFNTSFSGNIPDSISNLKHLMCLILSNSNFSGRISSSSGTFLISLILFFLQIILLVKSRLHLAI